jgi:Integrase core domain
LELVHSDVCGPINNVDAIGSFKYLLTFIDDFSRFKVIYLTHTKSGQEVLSHFQDYKAWAETATGHKLVKLRTDGGGEYINDTFDRYLAEHGIARQITPAYTPQHNGVAERSNRTIFEGIRCVLHRAGLSWYFWPEAARAIVYIRNRCPTRALPTSTPYEAWTGIKPSITELRVFGCVAHIHVPKQRRVSKLSDRSTLCLHMGYSTESKAYRLYDPTTGKIVISRDVTFDELRFADGTRLSTVNVRRNISEGEPVYRSPMPPHRNSIHHHLCQLSLIPKTRTRWISCRYLNLLATTMTQIPTTAVQNRLNISTTATLQRTLTTRWITCRYLN